MDRPRNNKGFNLVETLTASVILSGAVLTVGAISTRAMTETRLNRQYEVAASLIEKQFVMIDYVGIDTFLESGQTEGVLEQPEPGYRWQIETKYQDTDSLYLVTVQVSWVERGRPHSVAAQTMFNGMSLVINLGQSSGSSR